MKLLKWMIIVLLIKNSQGSPQYNDTCQYQDHYIDQNIRCGNQCTDRYQKCHCGEEIFKIQYAPKMEHFCCVPSNVDCSTKRVDRIDRVDGDCSEGLLLPWWRHCNNTDRSQQCHNSYQDSQEIGLYSHYVCPNACVHWSEMCQGISWCENDVKECNETLRCVSNSIARVSKHKVNSTLAPDHHYCIKAGLINNGEYNVIDRSDETKFNSEGTNLHINVTQFPKCFSDGRDETGRYEDAPGVMCGSRCRESREWCSERHYTICDHVNINTQDRRLCSNPLIWKDVGCQRYRDGASRYLGKRCTGRNMECVVPGTRPMMEREILVLQRPALTNQIKYSMLISHVGIT